VTPSGGGDTRMKLIFVAEFSRKNTGQTTPEGENCDYS